MYHKQCLTCTSCKSTVAPGAIQEHNLEPYCRNCHLRLFSTQDLRHGNLPTLPATSLILSTSSTPSPPQAELPLRESSSSHDVSPALRVPTKPPRTFSPTSTGNPINGLPRFGGARIECPKCHKAVYHAEQVVAVGKKWHRACLKCTSCDKRLDSHKLSDKDGEPYCGACYTKTHGPAGAGYALLGKAGG